MLPALKTGLMADDLVQRVVELKPSQLPARLCDMSVPPDSGSLGTVLCDLFPGLNRVAVGVPKCKEGDRYDLGGLTVEVLESDAAKAASRVAFRFDTSLDSPEFHWLWFDWRTFSYGLLRFRPLDTASRCPAQPGDACRSPPANAQFERALI